MRRTLPVGGSCARTTSGPAIAATPISVTNARVDPISDKPTEFSEITVRENRRQTTLLGQLDNKPTVGVVF
jgi:hypothetical protein